MSDRCEPPEELRGVDGWHWVQDGDAHPVMRQWGGKYNGWLSVDVPSTPWLAYDVGYRYLAPVVPPAEVDALRTEASEWRQKAQLFEGRIHKLRAELAAARGALKDATAHLFGAAAAYRKYGRQHKVRGPADPFYTTRANDFDRAAERARAATREPLLAALGDTP